MPPVVPHILLLEPYCGGSHQAFLQGMQQHLPFRFTLISLPARKWKMRMQLAAPWMAKEVVRLTEQGACFDAIVCSTFLDVATLRVLLYRAGLSIPLGLYFHENQFAYPSQQSGPTDYQFMALNFTSALAADTLAFNSEYNRRTFMDGVAGYLKSAADFDMTGQTAELRKKSRVLYPGLDFHGFARGSEKKKDQSPVILWNHRWEHDKDPETFFSALFKLSAAGADFKLLVLGQPFTHCPEIFHRARKALDRHILHFGYAAERSEYIRLLHRADIVVSTAVHEFFGMAVLEGVRCGCRPLVPDRLSYRELFPADYRYPEGGFTEALASLVQQPPGGGEHHLEQLADRFSWENMAGSYEQWLAPLL